MRVGFSTACFFSKLNTEDALSLLSERGVPAAEIFLNTYMEYTSEFTDELLTRRGNVDIHSVHAMTMQYEPMLFNINDRTRADAMATLRDVCRATQRLGAKYYTFHGPAIVKLTHRVPPMDIFGPKMRVVADIATEYGVTVAYENVHWCYYRTPEFITDLLQYVPSLYTTLDIKQARQSGYDWRDYLKAMGERVATVHVLDYTADGKMTLPTLGAFEYKELFERVYDLNPDADVMIEVYYDNYNNYDEVFASFDRLTDILNSTIYRR